MVARKKGGTAMRAGNKSGGRIAVRTTRKTIKKPAIRGSGQTAQRSIARRSAEPELRIQMEVARTGRMSWRQGQLVLTVEGVPMETVSLVYIALSQIRGILYGLAQLYKQTYPEDQLMVSFLEMSGADGADELNKVSGQRCDAINDAGDLTQAMPFHQALILLRDWLLDCMSTLIPPEGTEIVVDE